MSRAVTSDVQPSRLEGVQPAAQGAPTLTIESLRWVPRASDQHVCTLERASWRYRQAQNCWHSAIKEHKRCQRCIKQSADNGILRGVNLNTSCGIGHMDCVVIKRTVSAAHSDGCPYNRGAYNRGACQQRFASKLQGALQAAQARCTAPCALSPGCQAQAGQAAAQAGPAGEQEHEGPWPQHQCQPMSH